MATPVTGVRIPAALLAAIEAAAAREGRSRSEEILTALGERYLGEEASPLPKAAKASPKPKAEPPPLVPASKLLERDLSPKIVEAASSGSARGGGLVSRLSLQIGNSRGPMAKGEAKPKRRF